MEAVAVRAVGMTSRPVRSGVPSAPDPGATSSSSPRYVSPPNGRGREQAGPLDVVLLVSLPALVWAGRVLRPLGLAPDTAAALGVRVDRGAARSHRARRRARRYGDG